MKKYYIKPLTELSVISFEQAMLAGSNKFDGNNTVINPGTMTGGDGSDAGSRGLSIRDVWED